jgi:hypothetical protein
MVVVGLGHDDALNMDYWLVKNSFGPDWGEHGYLRLGVGANLCGISNYAEIVQI